MFDRGREMSCRIDALAGAPPAMPLGAGADVADFIAVNARDHGVAALIYLLEAGQQFRRDIKATGFEKARNDHQLFAEIRGRQRGFPQFMMH